MSPTEIVVVTSFHVELDGGGGDLHITMPYSMIEPLRELLDAGVASDRVEHDERWAQALKEEIEDVAVQDEFNWHNRSVELLGLRLGGMTLLQLLPCLLPVLLLFLRRRLRAAAASYSLFGTRIYGDMPTLCFKSRSLEGVALVLLPLLACASAGAALLMIDELPFLPALAALASLMLGTAAYGKLVELHALVASVVHSHSYPPPEA